jgi:hypothetical protein
MIEGHESFLAEMSARQIGQDDIFTRAIIENQLKNVDSYFEALLETGMPEEARAYMGMLGFRIRINVHGEVLEVEQPGAVDPGEE